MEYKRAFHSCKSGFRLEGPIVRNCLRSSEWEYPAPNCVAIKCEPIVAPENGYVSISKTSLGERASYVCDEGYHLIGLQVRTCLQNGTWTSQTPECLSNNQCYSLSIENSVITYGKESGLFDRQQLSYPVGTFAEVYCTNNTTMNGEMVLNCLENGSWDITPPICSTLNSVVRIDDDYFDFTTKTDQIPRDSVFNKTLEGIIFKISDSPNHPDREFWQHLKEYLFYGCNSTNSPRVSHFCDESIKNLTDLLNFNSSGVQVQRIDDNFYESLQYAVIMQNIHRVKLTADSLLEFILYGNGNRTIINESDNERSYRMILCFYIDAILLEDQLKINHSITIRNKQIQLFVEYLAMSIYDGYVLKQDSYNLENFNIFLNPSDKKLFTNFEIRQCNPMDLPKTVQFIKSNENGQSDDDKYEIGTIVNYYCDNGHKLIGDSLTECGSNGIWSNLNVSCKKLNECDQLPRPTNFVLKNIKEFHEIGDRIQIQCKIGYSIYGNTFIECLSTGKWSKISARCSSKYFLLYFLYHKFSALDSTEQNKPERCFVLK